MFLYIVPLKQGLKHPPIEVGHIFRQVFIHSSIKTRIETFLLDKSGKSVQRFLYIVPLKQGLKLKRLENILSKK